MIKDIAELTARYFDEIVLDDYYFTNCKCDLCIKAKGNRSWGDFRMDLLDKVGREMIVEPAHRVNPKCKVIIKYPNWYDHFHGLGFDLKHGPWTFDGVYTGTETRNPESEQHLQAYESFGIIRYFVRANSICRLTRVSVSSAISRISVHSTISADGLTLAVPGTPRFSPNSCG